MAVAFSYSRVSSREQEREGYSIPAQRKLLTAYARTRGFYVGQEFIDIESAKNPGRKEFTTMLRLLREDTNCRIVLVEKTDRLYRNRADALAFEELIETRGVEVHLVKEGRVISKESRSQDKFMHDIHVAVAKHYVENLKEEVKKGMREKAEQGLYPGRAPFGYRNNPLTRGIDLNPDRVLVVRRIFKLYATGSHSLKSLRTVILEETGIRINRAYLETMLKNTFYIGRFVWRGIEYKGNHSPIISPDLFPASARCIYRSKQAEVSQAQLRVCWAPSLCSRRLYGNDRAAEGPLYLLPLFARAGQVRLALHARGRAFGSPGRAFEGHLRPRDHSNGDHQLSRS
jgi:site-specific DNA recombinase